MYRSSAVGPLLIQGWCCSTDANSVEAIAARSFRMTWRYSSGICSTVSTLRIPRRTPHSTPRETDMVMTSCAAGRRRGPSIHGPSRAAGRSGPAESREHVVGNRTGVELLAGRLRPRQPERREERLAAQVVPLEEARVEDDARRVDVAPAYLNLGRVLDHALWCSGDGGAGRAWTLALLA